MFKVGVTVDFYCWQCFTHECSTLMHNESTGTDQGAISLANNDLDHFIADFISRIFFMPCHYCILIFLLSVVCKSNMFPLQSPHLSLKTTLMCIILVCYHTKILILSIHFAHDFANTTSLQIFFEILVLTPSTMVMTCFLSYLLVSDYFVTFLFTVQIDKIQKFEFFVNAGLLAFIRAFEAYGYAGYLYRLAV